MSEDREAGLSIPNDEPGTIRTAITEFWIGWIGETEIANDNRIAAWCA